MHEVERAVGTSVVCSFARCKTLYSGAKNGCYFFRTVFIAQLAYYFVTRVISALLRGERVFLEPFNHCLCLVNAVDHVCELFAFEGDGVIKAVCLFAQGDMLFYHSAAHCGGEHGDEYGVKTVVADAGRDAENVAQCFYTAYVVFRLWCRVARNAVEKGEWGHLVYRRSGLLFRERILRRAVLLRRERILRRDVLLRRERILRCNVLLHRERVFGICRQ